MFCIFGENALTCHRSILDHVEEKQHSKETKTPL